jgi:hypothetical protein
MKVYWGVNVQIHIILTSALAGVEWSASRPCRFTPRKEPPVLIFFIHIVGGGVQLGPLGTSATEWPIVPALEE